MKGYKEIIVPVLATMKWYAVDDSGAAYVSQYEPYYNARAGVWQSEYIMYRVGTAPPPKDASKELYRI